MVFATFAGLCLFLVRTQPGQIGYKAPKWTANLALEWYPSIVSSERYVFGAFMDSRNLTGSAFALHVDSGKLAWRRSIGKLGEGPYSLRFCASSTLNGVVFASSDGFKTRIVELAENDGAIRFETELAGGMDKRVSRFEGGLVFATLGTKSSALHFYSSAGREVTDKLPVSFYPRKGSRLVSFGSTVYAIGWDKSAKKLSLQDAGLGQPDEIWALSDGNLLTSTHYIEPQDYWSSETPPLPAAFLKGTVVFSLFTPSSPSLKERFDYQRAWTFQSDQDASTAPFASFSDVLEFGGELFAQFSVTSSPRSSSYPSRGYARFDLSPRILNIYPGRLMMVVDDQHRQVSVDPGAFSGKVANEVIVTISTRPRQASRKYRMLVRHPAFQEPKFIDSHAGLIVETYSVQPPRFQFQFYPTGN